MVTARIIAYVDLETFAEAKKRYDNISDLIRGLLRAHLESVGDQDHEAMLKERLFAEKAKVAALSAQIAKLKKQKAKEEEEKSFWIT